MNFHYEQVDARRYLVYSDGAIWIVITNGYEWTGTLYHGKGDVIRSRIFKDVLHAINDTSVPFDQIYLTHTVFRETMARGMARIPRAYIIINKYLERG